MALVVARRAGGAHARRIQTASGFAFGAGLMLLAVTPNFATALAVVFFVGAAAAGFQTMNNSMVLALSDLEYHGRIQSLMLLSFSGFGMAALPFGRLADAVGLRRTLMAMGVTTILCMVGYWLDSSPRHEALCRRRVRLNVQTCRTPVDPHRVQHPRLGETAVVIDHGIPAATSSTASRRPSRSTPSMVNRVHTRSPETA